MKKKFFALMLGLTLTTSIAFANTPTVSKDNAAKPITKTKKQEIITGIPANKPQLMTREEAKKQFEVKKAQEREMLYNALNFTAEQKIKAEDIDAKTRVEAKKYIKRVHEESKKLRELKSKKSSRFAIFRQSFAFKRAVLDANKFFEKSRKSFESIMTKEQKVKFEEINKAKMAEREMNRKRSGEHMGPGPKGPKLENK